jgi:hypothetical protein
MFGGATPPKAGHGGLLKIFFLEEYKMERKEESRRKMEPVFLYASAWDLSYSPRSRCWCRLWENSNSLTRIKKKGGVFSP